MSSVIEKLTRIYFDYGILNNKHIFKSDYYFGHTEVQGSDIIKSRSLRFFRRFFFRKLNLGLEHSYVKRVHTGEYFPLRFWLLRYNGWLVITINWFKPIKKKISQIGSGLGSGFLKRKSTAAFHVEKPKHVLTRLKLTLHIFLKSLNRFRSYYSF